MSAQGLADSDLNVWVLLRGAHHLGGDVLSGVLGALLAQGLSPGQAARLGVCLHARAGDLAAVEGTW